MKKKIQEIIIRNNVQQLANCLLPKNEEESELIKIFNETLKCINKALEEFLKEPTLDDCIKEWEERGWKASYIFDGINLSKLNDDIVEYFYFDKDLKRIDCNCFISFDLIPLIHKTLKALEVENAN